MAKISDVVRFEVIRTLKKRTFWFATIAPPMLLLAIFAINYLSSQNAIKTGQEQQQSFFKTTKVAILDKSGLIDKQVAAGLRASSEPSLESGIAAVKNGTVDVFFYYPQNVSKSGIKVYARDTGITISAPYNAAAVQILQQSVVASISRTARSPQAVRVLQKPPSVSATTYKDGVESPGIATIIAPGIFLLVFLILVVLLSYTIIASTTEEKENRTAEMLLTSISSRKLITGKLYSIFTLAAVQLTVMVIPLSIYYVLFQKTVSLPGNVSLTNIPLDPVRILFGVLLFIAGFVMYTGLVVGIGALFPNANEAGRFLGLAIIWAFIPIYILAIILSNPRALVVIIFTYFPLTAPTTALLRNTLGTLSTAEALGALAVIVVSAVLALAFAVRAFRFGAMAYGRRVSIKELLGK